MPPTAGLHPVGRVRHVLHAAAKRRGSVEDPYVGFCARRAGVIVGRTPGWPGRIDVVARRRLPEPLACDAAWNEPVAGSSYERP